jgi:hypothetical protein
VFIRQTVKILLVVFLLAAFTVVTQTGGIVLLCTIGIIFFLRKRLSSRWKVYLSGSVVFLLLYTISSFAIVPLVAKYFGRVPLPLRGGVKPLNIGTCILNRHYVRLALRDVIMKSYQTLETEYPGCTMNYLDAGFPFYDGFPLLPHLSHNDGRKLDLAFFYKAKNGKQLDDAPSAIGYGVYESPWASEENYAERCASKGYWQYGVMERIVSQSKKSDYIFDAKRTSELVNILSRNKAVEKIFIEPHLRKRLGLSSPKIRFHGCQAVRHDDHIHVQIY